MSAGTYGLKTAGYGTEHWSAGSDPCTTSDSTGTGAVSLMPASVTLTANLRVWHTAAEPRLGVGLSLGLPVAAERAAAHGWTGAAVGTQRGQKPESGRASDGVGASCSHGCIDQAESVTPQKSSDMVRKSQL